MSLPVHHLAFRTADVASLAAFYRGVLGLEVVRETLPRSVWLGLGPGAVLMIECRGEGEAAIPAGSMEMVAFAVDEATRDVVRRRALDLGIHDGETAFTVYLRDPDGRRIGVSTYDLSSVRG